MVIYCAQVMLSIVTVAVATMVIDTAKPRASRKGARGFCTGKGVLQLLGTCLCS